jgi:hypothetical protein
MRLISEFDFGTPASSLDLRHKEDGQVKKLEMAIGEEKKLIRDTTRFISLYKLLGKNFIDVQMSIPKIGKYGSSLFCMGALRISYRLGMNCRKSSYMLCYNVTINKNG